MTTPIERLTEALTDRYRIDREIGAGGMATVYLAHDIRHDRQVALKVLRPELSAILGAERFLAEIRTTANLQHPHILPLHDSGEAAGLVFYVMPFVEGESLRDRLKREQQLPIADAVKLAREVAGALDYAHRHGVVHRDIKPENILLHDGQALVADFGIALAVSRTDGSTRMTETGLSLGTPHYMSPEQAMGERTVDARTDVYALGCVLYEMLAGEPPFTGPSAQAIVAKVMASDPDAITTLRRSVPPHVNAVVHTAIQKLPADRFPTAAAFAEALGNAGYATTMSLPGVAGVGRQGLRQNRPALVMAAVAVAAVGLALWGWLRPGPAPEVSRYSILLPEGQVLGSSQHSRIAISPDGVVLVYRSGGRNNPLLSRRRDALVAEVLGGTEGGINPSFSPNGKRLAFVQGSPRALRVTSLVGGAPITLTDSLVDLGGVSWGHDGYIYFDGHLEGDGLSRVRETGGVPEPATRPDSTTESWHFQPEALPNGRGLLFTVSMSGGGWRVAASEAGSLHHSILVEGRSPKYSDGFLFYVTGEGNLMAAPFDQNKLVITGEAVPVAQELALRGLGRVDLTFSTTGTMMYTRGNQNEGQSELVWVTRDGQATVVDPNWPQVMSNPVLSPDGRRVAVTLSGQGQQDVWIKELDRGPATRISFGGRFNFNPAWTPDGRSILFTARGAQDGGPGGFMLGPADGARLPAPFRANLFSGGQAKYTSDGKWIVYDSEGDIYAIRTSGDSGVVELVRQPGAEGLASVSPDGRWLAYTTDESGQFQVYVTPFPDTKVAKSVVSVDGGAAPAWSPDGRELFYHTPAGEVIAARVLPGAAFAVTDRRVLFSTEGLRFGFGSAPQISPDGSRFLTLRPVGIGERPDELIVVENFLTEVKAKVKR